MTKTLKKNIIDKIKIAYHSFFWQQLSRNYCYYLGKNKRNVRGANNSIDIKKAFVSRCTFHIQGDSNQVVVGADSRISSITLFIRGNNCKVIVGKSCIIKGGELWIEDNHGQITIGAKTTIESAHIACTENHGLIQIGSDCMLANDVEIRNGDSHSILNKSNLIRINKAVNVLIDNHVWIGAHARIMKGVHIGESSIIALGSIVTHDVGVNTLHGGVPSRELKKDITWDRERK